MAKRSNDTVAEAGKSKIRIVFAEVEGSDDSLKSFMATIATAMARPATSHHRALPAGRPELVQPDGGASHADQADDALLKTDDSEAPGIPDSGPDPSSNATASTRRQRGDGQKVDRNSNLSLVPDLNLAPQDKRSLNDFITEVKPATDEERVLTFVQYMRETLGLQEITQNHVFSCFKQGSRKIPADLPQTIRNIVRKKGWLVVEGKNIRVSTSGSNHILHEMGGPSQGEVN